MKLSELTTDQAADVLCEITPFIMNIAGDKTLLDELKNKFDLTNNSVAEMFVFAADKYARIAPIVLKKHRLDVFSILAILNNTEVEKIANQNFIWTMKQIRDLLNDKELIDFFKSWQQQDKTE